MKRIIVLLALLSIFVSACASALPPQPVDVKTPLPPVSLTPQPEPTVPLPDPSAMARADLAARLGISEDQILIQAVNPIDWPDGCLGIAFAGEMCAEVIVPGYRVLLQANGQAYEYRTNLDGTLIRLNENITNSGPAESLLNELAERLQITPAEVMLISLDEVVWPDGCLGIYEKGIECTQALVPGYRIIFEALDQRYEFHTDTNATVAREQPAQPAIGPLQLTWYSIDQPCRMAQITQHGIASGACTGGLTVTLFTDPQRAVELIAFLGSYAAFQAGTPAGDIDFRGTGMQTATPAEQRSLAEWAAALAQGVAGRPEADAGLLLTWKRAGGIAGFCDEMQVFRSGIVQVASCKINQGEWQPGLRRLTSEELTQLYLWSDQFAAKSFVQEDAAVADSMRIDAAFFAQGQLELTPADEQLLLAFAGDLYARLSALE